MRVRNKKQNQVGASGERKKRSGDVEGEVWMGRDGVERGSCGREKIVSLSQNFGLVEALRDYLLLGKMARRRGGGGVRG